MVRHCLGVVLLSGCHLFFGDPPPECQIDDDCLPGTLCASGRCVTGTRAPPLDAGVREDRGPPDAAPDMAVVPDLALDAQPDAAVDAGGPFATGCFPEAAGVWVATADTWVPRGLCTPWAVVWTASGASGPELRILRQPGGPEGAAVGPRVSPADPLATDGRFLVYMGPDENQRLRAWRLDLQGESAAVALSATDLPNLEATRGPGVSAHVEEDGREAFVVLTFDDDTTVTCRRPGRRSSGVAVGADRVAWLEASVGGGRTELVVTRALGCEPLLSVAVPAAAGRVVAAGGGFWWVEGDRPVGLRPDARGRLRRVELAAWPGLVELAGDGGPHLAVVSFEGAGYVIDVVEAATGTVRAVAQAPARQPTLASGWLMWAQATPLVPWELRYVDQATLR